MTPETLPVGAPSGPPTPTRWTLVKRGLGDLLVSSGWMLISGFVLPPIYIIIAFATSHPLHSAADLPPSLWWLWACVVSVVVGKAGLDRIDEELRAGVPLILPASRPGRGWWRWFLVACAIVLVTAYGYEWILHILHLDPTVENVISRNLQLTKGWSLLLATIPVVILGPVAEELLFRGCVFGRFRAHGYWVFGAAFSALMFSFVHGIPVLMPEYCLAGIILAWLAHRTGSLWPSMVLHALNNAITVIQIRILTH